MCQLNGEMIVFGGSDENPGTPNSQPISKEVDAFVYHVRPRLRKALQGPSQGSGFGGGSGGSGGGGGGGVGDSVSSLALMLDRSQSPPQAGTGRHDRALLRWHERAMAEEVNAHMGLVEAAQERRAEAARAAAGGDMSLGAGAVPRFSAEAGAAGGAGGAAASSREHRPGPMMYPCTSTGIAAYLERVHATNDLSRPERGWLPREHEPTKMPGKPYGVKVCILCIIVVFSRSRRAPKRGVATALDSGIGRGHQSIDAITWAELSSPNKHVVPP